MSIILLIGLTLFVVGAIAVTVCLTRADDHGDTRDDFWQMHGSMSSISHILQMHKEGSTDLAELEKEVNRTSDEIARKYRLYRAESRRHNIVGYWLLGASVGVLILSGILHVYIDNSVQEAYQRGAAEAIQKANEQLKEALGVGQQQQQ